MTYEEATQKGMEWKNQLTPHLNRRLSKADLNRLKSDIEFLDMAIAALKEKSEKCLN